MSRGPGALPRLFDVVLIAVGAAFALRGTDAASQAGYGSATVAFALFLASTTFPALGMYRDGSRRPFWYGVCVPVVAWTVVLAGALAAVGFVHREYRPALDWVGCWAAISLGALVIVRLARFARGRRRAPQRTVAVVGSGAHAAQLMRNVDAHAESAYRVVLSFDPLANRVAGAAPCDPHAFAQSVRREHVDELWIALPLSEETTISQFAELFRNDFVNVRFMPDVRRLARFDADVVAVAGMLAVNLAASPTPVSASLAKAVFDRVFSAAVLIGLVPLLLGIALAVKLSSPGPVLFRQRRKGANGTVFDILKFRTMRVHEVHDGVVRQACRNDPRMTKVGAFLRRTSLDELPQFINVLRGEMSVVGPRPHAIEHDALYQDVVDRYIHRYRVKPGITGWAQVNGLRGATDSVDAMAARVEHDLHYLSNWSFGLDIRIVLMTVFKGMVHRNAY